MKNPLNILLLLGTIACAVAFFAVRNQETTNVIPVWKETNAAYIEAQQETLAASEGSDTEILDQAYKSEEKAREKNREAEAAYNKLDLIQLMLVIGTIVFASLLVVRAASK